MGGRSEHIVYVTLVYQYILTFLAMHAFLIHNINTIAPAAAPTGATPSIVHTIQAVNTPYVLRY